MQEDQWRFTAELPALSQIKQPGEGLGSIDRVEQHPFEQRQATQCRVPGRRWHTIALTDIHALDERQLFRYEAARVAEPRSEIARQPGDRGRELLPQVSNIDAHRVQPRV